MAGLRILCLGGFEATCDGEPLEGFESRKVRALLVYLVCQRDRRRQSREHLASLLWSDRDDEAARRNLRQAVYNLNQVFSQAAGSGDDDRRVLADSNHVYLSPDFDAWVDVTAFESALHLGTGAVRDPGQLAEAVSVYRGEFLEGFGTSKAEDFDDWMGAEARRLREAYIEALRALIESFVERGELRFGIPYARRLADVDPLSEEAHRYLIRLYASTGRRGRALRQYQLLEQNLREELGVEPSAASQALVREVLVGADPAAEESDDDPVGPILPLVGREQELDVLRAELARVQRGEARCTLIHGKPGHGKTRLVKSFLHAATRRSETWILLGRCDHELPTAYDPFPQMLAGLLEYQDDSGQEPGEGQGEDPRENPRENTVEPEIEAQDLADLVRLRPDLYALRPDVQLDLTARHGSPAGAVRRAIAGLLASGHSVVLFVDQIHDAPRESVELLENLFTTHRSDRLWILGASARAEIDLPVGLSEHCESLWLSPLTPADLTQAAESLVSESSDSEALAAYLKPRVLGHPLRLVELLNTLWSRGGLRGHDAGSWRLERRFSRGSWDRESTGDLVRDRVQRLPTSARRLATLASVLGHRFDRKVLELAADEHPGVVEIALEILLEKWVIRQAADAWASGRRESDLALWGRGNRGRFEFAHEAIRVGLYKSVQPKRAKVLHSQAADAMLRLYDVDQGLHGSEIAWQLRRAGRDREAVPHLLAAMERARKLGAVGTLQHLRRQVRDVLTRIGDSDADELQRWRSEFEHYDTGTGGISREVIVSLTTGR